MNAMVQVRRETGVGWIVTGEPAGPAGSIDLMLDAVRVSVDAANPARLVEIASFGDSPAAVAAIRGIVGDPAAELVQSGVTAAEAAAVEGPVWPHISDLAAAELAAQRHTPVSRLAALEVVRCASEIAAVGGTLLRDRAWQALPAAAAFGRAAARDPELIDSVPGAQRGQLAAAVTALTSTLAADGWDDSGGDAIRDLYALLAGAPGDADLLLVTEAPMVEFRGAAAGPGTPSWLLTRDDLRTRLNGFADAAFAGATATGQVPGSIVVQLPLRPDLAIGMPEVVVRVLTRRGTVLGRQPLRVRASPGQITQGSCRLAVTPPDDIGPLDTASVTVDVALAFLPAPDAESLRRMARARAARAGKEAVLHRYAGTRVAETMHWRRCAQLWQAAGEPKLAAEATANASRPSAQPSVSWAGNVLLRLRGIAARAVRDPAGLSREECCEKLYLLVRDLSAAAESVPELVSARERLARLLLAGGQDDRDEAADQLSEALETAYLLGDETSAARLLRALHDLPQAEETAE